MSDQEYMDSNQQRWNEMVGVHEKSAFYDVDGFKAGRITVPHLERAEVGDVSGKSLLHLQCHFGMDTMSWARLGAIVTGVDYSEQAIELARSLAQELGINARFVCSNVYDLLEEALIPDKFDIVYTSNGVLSWLPDLKPWGKIIADHLKPGGTFYLLEAHPFMYTLKSNQDLEVTYPYFASETLRFDYDHSYADRETVLEHNTEYNWNHSLSEIINALLSQNLALEFLHEFPFCSWDYFSDMEEVEIGGDKWHQLKDPRKREMVPQMFSLKAKKR
jgi:SAM-dependent methyltransferase